MALRPLIVAASAAVFLALTGTATAASQEPWEAAADVRTTLAEAQRALVLGEPEKAKELVGKAAGQQLGPLGPAAKPGLADATEAVAAEDPVALEIARAATWTAILAEAGSRAVAAAVAGDVAEARAWLLVREFRTPTRFTRPGADGTLALQALEQGRMAAAAAAAAVRADLFDTYQARLRVALEDVAGAAEQDFAVRLAGAASLARGYFAILEDAYAKQRSAAAGDAATGLFEELVAAAQAQDPAALESALGHIDDALEGFRAAPLSRGGAAAPRRPTPALPRPRPDRVWPGRGRRKGHARLRDPGGRHLPGWRGAGAWRPRAPARRADAQDTKRLGEILDGLSADLAAAARQDAVADPDDIQAATDEALGIIDSLYPDQWKEAGATADFDVISATLDRLEAAIAAGQFAQAEQARLEAYAFFEFGPEQRLRGLASGLFVEVEGLFWYGADGCQASPSS